MDYTLLRKFCERARLFHTTQSGSCTCSTGVCDCTGGNKNKNQLFQALYQTRTCQEGSVAVEEPITDNRYNYKGEVLEESVYDKLVKRLQADGTAVVHRSSVNARAIGYTKDATVPRHVVTQRSFSKDDRKYTCRSTHPGSAAVLFQLDGVTRFGFINTIWDQSISGIVRRHVLVSPLKVMNSEDEAKTPFSGLPGLACGVVYNISEEDVLITTREVIVHAAFRVRPACTFGISCEIVLYHNLDRGRRVPLFL